MIRPDSVFSRTLFVFVGCLAAISSLATDINGQPVGESNMTHARLWDTGLFIGRAAGSPVSAAFTLPFAFSGALEEVKVEMQ